MTPQSLSISKTIATSYAPSTSLSVNQSANSNTESVAQTASATSSGNGKEKNLQAAVANPAEVASNLANMATNTLSEVLSSTLKATPTKTSDALDTQTASTATTIASSTAAVVQIPPSNTYMFAPVTPIVSASSVAKPTIQYPSAQDGNNAMASGYNQIYKTLDMTSKCNANDKSQAFACITGELAQCQADGTYVLKSCDNGQSCYALPMPSGQNGVSVECAVPSDAAARLAAQPTSAFATGKSVAAFAETPASFSASSIAAVSKAASTIEIPAARTSNDISQNGSAQIAQVTSTIPAPSAQTAKSTIIGGSNTNIQATGTQTSQAAPTVKGSATNTAENGNNQGILTKTPQTESIQIPVETSVSLGQLEAISHTLPVESAPSISTSTFQTTEAANGNAGHQTHGSEAATEAAPTATADSGPLFSLPNAAPSSPPKNDNHDAQPTQSSAAPPATSTPAPGPSLLAEQKPAPPSGTPAAPSPHFIQTAEKPQQTPQIGSPTPASSADAAGITFVPLGGNMGVNNNQGGNGGPNQGGNEKVAIAANNNNNNGNTPIYITVTTTVTTTAYTRGP